MNFIDGAADHAVARNIFLRPENIFRGIVGVNVRRDVIEWDMLFGAVTDERVNPCGLRGCRAADPQLLIYFFHCERRMVVEIPISFLLRIARPKINIGFVPDFEIPLRDFIEAIAIYEVMDKMR